MSREPVKTNIHYVVFKLTAGILYGRQDFFCAKQLFVLNSFMKLGPYISHSFSTHSYECAFKFTQLKTSSDK